ncbi:MAG: hypothetical protein ACHQ53_12620 [Polyangiales bacterium]
MTRLAWLLLALAVASCGDHTTNLVTDPLVGRDAGTARDASTTRAMNDAAMKSAVDASAPLTGPRVPTQCGDHVCACDNGRDDDGDGLVDGLDPECTGPFDDDESTFATGAPAPPGARCRDCFWDNNAGSGNDDCRYPSECLSGGSPTGKGGNCASCDPSQKCVDTCGSRTPNGCDCFGCCEIHRSDGSRVLVELSDTCSLQKLDDTAACPRCVQSSGCRNDCGPCELCPGRSASDLAPECATAQPPGTPLPYTCNPGQQVCGPSAPCPAGTYCQQGCCLYAVQ